MNVKKLFSYTLLLALTATTFSSCNNDDDDDLKGPGIPATTNVVQRYTVQYSSEVKQPAVFANISMGATNTMILPAGAVVYANNVKLDYLDVSSDNYGAFLPVDTKEFTFNFRKNETQTFVNTVTVDERPEISVEIDNDGRDLTVGKEYKYKLSGPKGVRASILLQPLTGAAYVHEADIMPATSTFRFRDVPDGVYALTLIAEVDSDLQQDDNGAGGKITVRNARFSNVSVSAK